LVGLAAVLNGAPVNAFDLDIVPARNQENVAKLLSVLEGMNGASHLSSPGHQNLMTDCGPLDVLGTIGRGMGFEDLVPHTIEMEIGRNKSARAQSGNEELAGEKDRAVLPVLRRTLQEKQGGK